MQDEPKRAYNALLTLLDDGSVAKKRKVMPQDGPQMPVATESASQDDVEGFDVDEPAEDDEIQAEDDNEGDVADPFEWHFAHPPENMAIPASGAKWPARPVNMPLLGSRSMLSTPPKDVLRAPNQIRKVDDIKLKHRLVASWNRVNPELSPLQLELATPLMGYQDVFFSSRNIHNAPELQNLYLLHSLNHVYKTRDRVLKNTSRSHAQKGTNNESKEETSDMEDDDSLRDQGFTRPKVLILLPTRHTALQLVDRLFSISGLRQMESRKRFQEAFGGSGSDLSAKPEDFQSLFAGNTDDLFCLGLKFTRQALKLYASFYQSDIIIASPLGLRLVINKNGESDFLSSIEMLVLDHVDAMQMQAWENVGVVMDHLNKMPKDGHGCDFSRIRPWYLDENAKYLRQTVMLGSYATPEMVATFTRKCMNVGGKLRCRPDYNGMLGEVGMRIRQVFTRIGPHPFTADADNRFQYFTTVMLPSLLRGAQLEGTLIVVPTYLDFVRVRNYLEHNDHSYVSLSEYTPPSQQARGRSFFADGRAKMMLYSARLHHYRRYGLKGVRTVVFYGLPDNPQFFVEMVRYLARTVIEHGIDPDVLKVQVLYSKWDALKLERIVGTKRMGPLLEGASSVYDFY